MSKTQEGSAINTNQQMDRRDFLKMAGTGFGSVMATSPIADWLGELASSTEAGASNELSETEVLAAAEDMLGQINLQELVGATENNINSTLGSLESKLGVVISADLETVSISPEFSKVYEAIETNQQLLEANQISQEKFNKEVNKIVAGLKATESEENQDLHEREAEHHEDPNAKYFDRLGTGYFFYALAKLSAQGVPGVNRKLANFLGIATNQPGQIDSLEPHFNRVDYGVSIALMTAALASAREHNDHEREHELLHGIEETIIATVKVGADIAMSIVTADIMQPVMKNVLKGIDKEAAGDHKRRRQLLYRAIHFWAGLGSGLISTNLGVSLTRDLIWEYAKIDGGTTKGPDTGDDTLLDSSEAVYDMNLVYYMTAMVADLTGDVAIANAFIAAGDIAPGEVASLKLGFDNLNILRYNSIPQRIYNTLAGFPMTIAAINQLKQKGIGLNYKTRSGRRVEPADVIFNEPEGAIEATMIITEDADAYVEAEEKEHNFIGNVFSGVIEKLVYLTRDKMTKNLSSAAGRVYRVVRERASTGVGSLLNYRETVVEHAEHYKQRRGETWQVLGVPLARLEVIEALLEEGEEEILELQDKNTKDAYEAWKSGVATAVRVPVVAPHKTSEITVFTSQLRKFPVIGKPLAALIDELEALSHIPASYSHMHHHLNPILTDAMNVLPYQLFNAAFVGGFMRRDLNNFRTGEANLIDRNTDLLGIILNNQTMHLPLTLTSGFADNGFTMAVLADSIIADCKKFIEDGMDLNSISDYLTIEIQKAYSGSQAGGMGSMIGCSAHFNNLTLLVQGIVESAFVGLPASLSHYLQMTIVNALAFKLGLMRPLEMQKVPKLKEAFAQAEAAIGLGGRAVNTGKGYTRVGWLRGIFGGQPNTREV